MKKRGILDESLRAFFRDRLLVAVLFGLSTLVALYVWWLPDDFGALVAAIIFAGVSAQQFYRYYLQKCDSTDSGD